jgi:hypothetical protein
MSQGMEITADAWVVMMIVCARNDKATKIGVECVRIALCLIICVSFVRKYRLHSYLST